MVVFINLRGEEILCLVSSVDNFVLETLVGIGRASLAALPEHCIDPM